MTRRRAYDEKARAPPMRQMRFEVARKNNYVIDCCANQDEDAARNLWQTLTTGIAVDSRNNDVLDTIPSNLASVFQTDSIITSAVIGTIWGTFSNQEIKSGFSLREALRKNWEVFEKNQKERDQIQKGFGWDQSTASHCIKQLQDSGIDTAKIVRIAKLAGRMYSDLKGNQDKEVLGMPASVCTVSQGSAIQKLIPSELSLLSNLDTQNLLLYRLATNKATIYQTKGPEKKSRGPMIVGIDESSSMHGIREEFAASCAIALSRVAIEQKRQVSVVHFSTSVIVQDLNPNNPADIVKLITKELDGGTCISLALNACVDKLKEIKKSDVIFITDGVDYDSEITPAVEKLVKNGRLFTVAIECEIKSAKDANEWEKNASPLRDKASEYIHLGSNDVKTGSGVVQLGKAAKG